MSTDINKTKNRSFQLFNFQLFLLLFFCTVALFTALPVYATDVDSYTKLLLQMDGSDGSTTISDSTGKTVTNPESYDSYTKLMLHFNGTNGSTTFTDSATSKSVTASGNAKIDTAQSKFGGASGLFNGTTDYLSLADI
ncbi:MAG: hypothetical protein HY754_00715 [Nitrospirae bacterium]|nr:hypothetical protein [Nitrospirota bacterium]